MTALLSVFASPAFALTAVMIALGLAMTAGWLVACVLRLSDQLTEADQIAARMAADRDSALADLALTRARLVEARQAAGRVQATVVDLEARLKPEITIERRFGEGRIEKANRVVIEALRDRPQ